MCPGFWVHIKAGRFFLSFCSPAALQAQICCMKNCVDINEIYSRQKCSLYPPEKTLSRQRCFQRYNELSNEAINLTQTRIALETLNIALRYEMFAYHKINVLYKNIMRR